MSIIKFRYGKCKQGNQRNTEETDQETGRGGTLVRLCRIDAFCRRIKVERERQRLNDDGHGIGCPVIAERNIKERENVVRQVRRIENVAADQNCRQSECRRKPRPVRIRRKETAQSRRVKKHRDRKAGTEHQVEQPESRVIHRDHHIRNHRQDQRRRDTVNNRAVAVRQIASLEEADQQDCRRDQDDVRHIRFHGV